MNMNRKQITFALNGLLMLLMLVACSEDPQEQAKKKGQELWFEEYVHDYGQIALDSDGSWTFTFKNVSENAIIINRVRSTCGCTVPAWPKEPIEPGSTGEITVKYNTATSGTFLKSLFVYSTAANSPVKLQIKGKVVAEEK